MALNLTKPSAGTVGWADAINQNFTDIENAVRLPTRYIEGLLVAYASNTTLTVSPGSCQNAANTDSIELAVEKTANVTTGHDSNGIAQAGGLDEKGLDNLSSGSITCSQSGTTITATGDVTSHLGTRAGTGQITTSGTSCTGTGTKFLSEVAQGDLIGTSDTHGWGQVAAVNSDTSLTITALPGGNITSAKDFTIIHNGTIQPDKEGSGTATGINSISAAGTSIVVPNSASHIAPTSLTIGVEIGGLWLAVWVIGDGSSPDVLLSTQREDLLAPPSGYTSARRVGWMRNNNSANFRELYYNEGLHVRAVDWEIALATDQSRLVSNSSSTSWTSVLANQVCPPTSRALHTTLRLTNSPSNRTLYVRARNRGPSTTTRARHLAALNASTTEPEFTHARLPVDGAQAFDHVVTTGTAGLYIDVFAFEDVL